MKQNKKLTEEYEIETENLAVPEIHTGKIEIKDEEPTEIEDEIVYDDVAIPEIHIKKKKSK